MKLKSKPLLGTHNKILDRQLKQQTFIYLGSGGWKLEIRVLVWLVLVRARFLACRHHLLAVLAHGGGDTNPIMGPHPHDLIQP